jgi:hypothetical protein
MKVSRAAEFYVRAMACRAKAVERADAETVRLYRRLADDYMRLAESERRRKRVRLAD